jgi:hypothetical protein
MIKPQILCDMCKEPCNSWLFVTDVHDPHRIMTKTFHICGISCLFSWVNAWAYGLRKDSRLTIRHTQSEDELGVSREKEENSA